MNTSASTSRSNRGKWLILLIFIVACATILPLSWNAIQAQRAQQKTMKALKKSLSDISAALKNAPCSAVLAPTAALNTQAHNVESVFPRLVKAPGNFAKLSRALIQSSDEFSAQAKSADCHALSLQLPELKKRCDACHEIFHPEPKRKLE